MTTKLQALITGWVAGISAFIAWLMTVPPEQQTALILPLLNIVPQSWRDSVGLGMRILATVSTIYAVYKAAHSGPQTPPQNKPAPPPAAVDLSGARHSVDSASAHAAAVTGQLSRIDAKAAVIDRYWNGAR